MLPVSTPLSEIDMEFSDIGGAGAQPHQLAQGLAVNGIAMVQNAAPQTPAPSAPSQMFAGLIGGTPKPGSMG